MKFRSTKPSLPSREIYTPKGQNRLYFFSSIYYTIIVDDNDMSVT